MQNLSLRFSAYLGVLCVEIVFNTEDTEVRREPPRRLAPIATVTYKITSG